MRMHIRAYPLASERKPASGRARLAAQGRKDGPERVNPILKKIRKGDLQENFFKKSGNRKMGFSGKDFFKKSKKKLFGKFRKNRSLGPLGIVY